MQAHVLDFEETYRALGLHVRGPQPGSVHKPCLSHGNPHLILLVKFHRDSHHVDGKWRYYD